jgi:hypothetical protein
MDVVSYHKCHKIKKSLPKWIQYLLNNDQAQHFHNEIKLTGPGGSHISITKHMDLKDYILELLWTLKVTYSLKMKSNILSSTS